MCNISLSTRMFHIFRAGVYVRKKQSDLVNDWLKNKNKLYETKPTKSSEN